MRTTNYFDAPGITKNASSKIIETITADTLLYDRDSRHAEMEPMGGSVGLCHL